VYIETDILPYTETQVKKETKTINMLSLFWSCGEIDAKIIKL